jgi:hypothetical protein
MIKIDSCKLIELPKIVHREGNISSINNNSSFPFNIRRIFYLYDIPSGESRGAHAHKICHQFLVACSGSFEVMIDDGISKRIIELKKPNIGLHIPPCIWASEINFSAGAICLVMASEVFDESDYIREYDSFINFKNH